MLQLVAAITASGQHCAQFSAAPRATGKANADADAIVTGDWKVFRCSPPVITDHDPSEPPLPSRRTPSTANLRSSRDSGPIIVGRLPCGAKSRTIFPSSSDIGTSILDWKALVRSRDFGWVLRAWNSSEIQCSQ